LESSANELKGFSVPSTLLNNVTEHEGDSDYVCRRTFSSWRWTI